jgi:hypothetical protein
MMPDMDPCELCSTQAERVVPGGGYDGIHQRCPRCGEFKLARTTMIRQVPKSDKVKISGWVRDQNQLGEVPELTSDRISLIAAAPLPGIVERADRLLSHAARSQEKLGGRVNMHPASIAVTYSNDWDEVVYLAKFLKDEGLINFVDRETEIKLTPRGHMRYDSLQTRPSTSIQGFIAMWFDESMREAYAQGFEAGIRRAGYKPLRVDGVEHVGKIDDEIVAQIRRSRFVVADFTGHRAGVYFEAGFALGLNMPVIWSCRRDEIGKLHFDIRQFNCIDWTAPNELADRLQKRIEAVIGAGPEAALRMMTAGASGGR